MSHEAALQNDLNNFAAICIINVILHDEIKHKLIRIKNNTFQQNWECAILLAC